MGIAQEICNKVMSEVQGIKDTGFPLDAFPEKVQTIILDMVRYENFKVEYLAPILKSIIRAARSLAPNVAGKPVSHAMSMPGGIMSSLSM